MVNTAPIAAIAIPTNANIAAGAESSPPNPMRQAIHKAITHATLMTMNVTVRSVNAPHLPRGPCDGSVLTPIPAAEGPVARAATMRFHSARKTMYPIASIASSQKEFPGPTTSEIAMSITTHDDAKIAVLALFLGTAIPKVNKTAPVNANATND